MAEWEGRSDEEREAARLERERQRAARGATAPDPPAPAPPEPSPPAASPPPQPPPQANFGDSVNKGLTQTPKFDQDGEEGEWDGSEEVPSGTRRVAWRERTRAAQEGGAPPPATGPRPARGHSRRARIFVVIALILTAALVWFLVELFQPFHGSGHGSVTVTIPAHSSSSQVGDLLEAKGVVSSSFFFEIRAFLSGDKDKLRAGTYHLKQDMSYGSALKVLTTPPPPVKTTGVTLVPGTTRAQVAARLHAEGVRGGYATYTRHSPLLNPAAYGAPRHTPSLEGFLFPDTYQLRVPVSIPALVAEQLKTFKKRFATVGMGYARSKHLTPYDVLIIASIIEKEAATARDQPLVASVIYNRLHDHVPLGMDSTTRYEFNDYTKPLTQSQLASPSPYNTRTHDGLPPTPISNPGMAAIRAAANPARTSYLYFVVKPCGNGESVFESNYQKFLQDSARYQAARARRGGRSPTNC